jgi:hypothetical protein
MAIKRDANHVFRNEGLDALRADHDKAERFNPDTHPPILASKWLDAHQAVEQMTWAPGKQMLIRDRLISGVRLD